MNGLLNDDAVSGLKISSKGASLKAVGCGTTKASDTDTDTGSGSGWRLFGQNCCWSSGEYESEPERVWAWSEVVGGYPDAMPES